MSSLETWVAILGLTLVTIVTRAGFLLLPERFGLPAWLNRGLQFAPACALVAIIIPELGLTTLSAHTLAPDARLLGLLSGVVVFLGSRSMLGTIAVGMLVFSLARQ